jgi:hypothetical protein
VAPIAKAASVRVRMGRMDIVALPEW